MYLIYSLIYLLFLFFLLPFEYLKRHRDLRRRWLKERFGKHSAEVWKSRSAEVKTSELPIFRASELKTVWIHAVSVGEVIAAVSLIRKIKERHPTAEIIVSTVTDTGQKVARERIGDIARIVYVPFDLPFAVNSALKKFKPSLFIIMETELWPNAIRILGGNGVPVLLMNGRISGKSFSGYKKLRFFIKDVLKNVSIFCMQNELYSERIRELGAEPDKIKTIGNLKFDTRPSSTVPEWTRILQGTTMIAGSTHGTEEDIILDAYVKLKSDFPMLNLIVAPRHPERFKEVEELIKKRGVKYFKRSELAEGIMSGVVILLDVIGELASVYGACAIAVIGGSFIEHGGQNPLEPAYWSKAIVCGPHMENFPFIDEFYKSGGALRVEEGNLYQALKDILNSPEKMSAMGKTAKDLHDKNSGAVERAMEEIKKYL
ncbi:MAG: 3-deoxy-D-manno-octulosonic acid transferase [Thermodesulfovibrionales bacterium]|nr:3-deoxy-D-manno-octulosonic acid transferase [Thermodesulfovibrionales bacterium]